MRPYFSFPDSADSTGAGIRRDPYVHPLGNRQQQQQIGHHPLLLAALYAARSIVSRLPAANQPESIMLLLPDFYPDGQQQQQDEQESQDQQQQQQFISFSVHWLGGNPSNTESAAIWPPPSPLVEEVDLDMRRRRLTNIDVG